MTKSTQERLGEEIERFKEFVTDEPDFCAQARARGDYDQYEAEARLLIAHWARAHGYDEPVVVEYCEHGCWCGFLSTEDQPGLTAEVMAIVQQGDAEPGPGDLQQVDLTLSVRYFVIREVAEIEARTAKITALRGEIARLETMVE